jgi:hypothetical protein
LLVFAERDHLIEDAAVLFQEKIFGLEIFDGSVEGVIIEQNGAKNGAFGFEILWQWAFESGFSRHRDSFVFAFYSLYSILPCGRQYRSAEKVSGAARCRRIARIVTASVHDVNERRLCKISEEVEKFFALAILFYGAARIEERFLACLRRTGSEWRQRMRIKRKRGATARRALPETFADGKYD